MKKLVAALVVLAALVVANPELASAHGSCSGYAYTEASGSQIRGSFHSLCTSVHQRGEFFTVVYYRTTQTGGWRSLSPIYRCYFTYQSANYVCNTAYVSRNCAWDYYTQGYGSVWGNQYGWHNHHQAYSTILQNTC